MHHHSYPESRLALWHNHRFWYWGIFSAFAASAFLLLIFANVRFERDFNDSQRAVPMVSKDRAVMIRVLIDFGGITRAFEGEAQSGMTVEAALGEIARIGNLELIISRGSIASLEGRRSGREKQWSIYVNNQEVSDMSQDLKGGDRVAVRYE